MRRFTCVAGALAGICLARCAGRPEPANGKAIPIEERSAAEVTGYAGVRWAPEGVEVANPAFDITPAKLVSALFTERGVVKRPNAGRIRRLFKR